METTRCKACGMPLKEGKDFGTNKDGSKNEEYCFYCYEDGVLAKSSCQSCGMPLRKDSDFGTNADGSQNEDFCTYCYQGGAFTQDCTMEEMVDMCIEHTKDDESWGGREDAKKQMMEYFVTLKRWK